MASCGFASIAVSIVAVVMKVDFALPTRLLIADVGEVGHGLVNQASVRRARHLTLSHHLKRLCAVLRHSQRLSLIHI